MTQMVEDTKEEHVVEIAEALRRELSTQLLPHVKRFYQDEGYLRETYCTPFYHSNCSH